MNEPDPPGALDEILVIADSIAERANPVMLFHPSTGPFSVPFSRLVEGVGRQAAKDDVNLMLGMTTRDVAFGIVLGQIFSMAQWQDVVAAVRTFR